MVSVYHLAEVFVIGDYNSFVDNCKLKNGNIVSLWQHFGDTQNVEAMLAQHVCDCITGRFVDEKTQCHAEGTESN